MTSLERCLRALRHQVPDRIPVMLYDAQVAARVAGYDMIEFSKESRKLAHAHLEAQQMIGYDGIIVGCDAVVLAEAIGAEVSYSADAPPRHKAGCIDRLRDYTSLRMVDPWRDGRLPVWLEAMRIVVEKKGQEVFVMGRADQGPFSLACMVRGIDGFLMEVAEQEDPDAVRGFLRYCKECTLEFIKAVQSVGVHITSIGDSISGPDVISPAMYRQYVFPLHQELAEDCKRIGIPLSIHICGKTEPILDDWVDTGAEMLEIDHRTDLRSAMRRTAGRTCILGNVDTGDVLSRGRVIDVEDAVKAAIAIVMPRSGFILNAGCLIPAETPVDNLKTMVELAKTHGVYAPAT